MAWPLTPLTTYVANSTPAIKAADLNSIQDAINKSFLGTYSIKSLTLDGTGGQVVSPTAAQLVVKQATSTDSPLAIFKDQGGNAKGIYDHIGYKMGRITEFNEPWMYGDTSVATTTAISPDFGYLWGVGHSGTGGGVETKAAGTWNKIATPILKVTAPTNGAALINSALNVLARPDTSTLGFSAVLEFEAVLLGAMSAGQSVIIGFFGDADNYAYFSVSAGNKWVANYSSSALSGSSTTSTIDSFDGSNTPCRFRIEIHDQASYLGAATLRFIINQTVVRTETLLIPQSAQEILFKNTGGAGGGQALYISPVRFVCNRFLGTSDY